VSSPVPLPGGGVRSCRAGREPLTGCGEEKKPHQPLPDVDVLKSKSRRHPNTEHRGSRLWCKYIDIHLPWHQNDCRENFLGNLCEERERQRGVVTLWASPGEGRAAGSTAGTVSNFGPNNAQLSL